MTPESKPFASTPFASRPLEPTPLESKRSGSRRSLTWAFVRLKVALLKNGLLRSNKSVWHKVGTWAALVMSVTSAIAGAALAISMRAGWSDTAERRFLVLAVAGIVLGWWFGPMLSGGADETVDPHRLALLPLSRSQLRRGQIAAGFVGPAPMMVTVWCVGLVVGRYDGLTTLPLVVLLTAVVLLAALVGSRSIATTLALMNRTRRGGDIATFVAVVGAAGVFAAMQALQFIDSEQLDWMTDVAAKTPMGMAGQAYLEIADGNVVGALWRTAALGAVVFVTGWWWSRALDTLMTEADTRSRADDVGADVALPIFGGWRARLPKTPIGAALAREVVYLRRSPGRRAAFLTSLILGFVYVALLAARGQLNDPLIVLLSPLAMVFALQYSANQTGVDPAAFWVEVVAGPPPAARWAGRQALGAFSVFAPVVITGLVLAAISGGWTQFAIMIVTMVAATPAMVGLGSAMSPPFTTPVPDNGNPFGNRQSMQGTGCVAGLVGIAYMVVVAALVAAPELALLWAAGEGRWLIAGAIAAVTLAADVAVWWFSTRFAMRYLAANELVVLERLDARLNA